MTWEDQGLWFTFILNSIALGLLIPIAFFLHTTKILSIARIFRPNHTVEPSSLSKEISATPVAPKPGFPRQAQGDKDNAAKKAETFEKANERGNNKNGCGRLDTTLWSSMFSPIPIRRLLSVGEERWEGDADDVPLRRDPHADLFLMFLKSCALILFFGSAASTVWLAAVYSKDNYVQQLEYNTDPAECRGSDSLDCGKNPLCKWTVFGTCEPALKNGLYDLSLQNVSPESDKLWAAGILAALFSIIIGTILFFTLRSITAYNRRVMKRQLRYAVGYRTVVVKGLKCPSSKTVKASIGEDGTVPDYIQGYPGSDIQLFREQYLSVKSYFGEDANGEQTIDSTLGFLGGQKVTADDLSLFQGRDPDTGMSSKIEDIVMEREPHKKFYARYLDYEEAKIAFQDAVADEASYHEDLVYQREMCYGDLEAHNREANGAGPSISQRDAAVNAEHQQQQQQQSTAVSPLGNTNTPNDDVRTPNSAYRYNNDGNDDGNFENNNNGETTSNTGSYHPKRRTREERLEANRGCCSCCCGPNKNDPKTAIDYQQEYLLPPLMGRIIPSKCCCTKVPVVEYRRDDLIKKANSLNKSIALGKQEPFTGSVFIIFKDALSAFEFVDLFERKYGGYCSFASARIAGPYDKLEVQNLGRNKFLMWVLFFFFMCAFAALVLFWSIPVAFLGSLDSLASIPGIGAVFQKLVDALPVTILGILTAYLPVIVLAVFNILLPIVIRFFVVNSGSLTMLDTDHGVMVEMYVFLCLTGVVFQAALQGGVAQLGSIITDPTKDVIFAFVTSVISPKGGYWYATIISAGCLSTWIQALLIAPFLLMFLLSKRATTQRGYNAFFNRQINIWPLLYAFALIKVTIGLFFHVTVPLLGIFAGLFFVMQYIVYRGLLLDNHAPEFHPDEMCSNFRFTSATYRIIAICYLIATFGAAIVVGLKEHTGGLTFCCIAAAIAFSILCMTYHYTRKWVPNLKNCRSALAAVGSEDEQKMMASLTSRKSRLHGNNNNNNGSVTTNNVMNSPDNDGAQQMTEMPPPPNEGPNASNTDNAARDPHRPMTIDTNNSTSSPLGAVAASSLSLNPATAEEDAERRAKYKSTPRSPFGPISNPVLDDCEDSSPLSRKVRERKPYRSIHGVATEPVVPENDIRAIEDRHYCVTLFWHSANERQKIVDGKEKENEDAADKMFEKIQNKKYKSLIKDDDVEKGLYKTHDEVKAHQAQRLAGVREKNNASSILSPPRRGPAGLSTAGAAAGGGNFSSPDGRAPDVPAADVPPPQRPSDEAAAAAVETTDNYVRSNEVISPNNNEPVFSDAVTNNGGGIEGAGTPPAASEGENYDQI